MRSTAAAAVLVVLFLNGVPATSQQQSAPQVAAALQAKYDRVKDFSADFTQQYLSLIHISEPTRPY